MVTGNRDHPKLPKLLLRVEEAAECLNIGRTTVFALIREGILPSVKYRGIRRVPTNALPEAIAELLRRTRGDQGENHNQEN